MKYTLVSAPQGAQASNTSSKGDMQPGSVVKPRYSLVSMPEQPAADPVMDAAKSLPSGIGEGALGLVGLPGTIREVLKGTAAAITQKLGGDEKLAAQIAQAIEGGLVTVPGINFGASGADLKSDAESAGVKFHSPQTTAGEYARTIGQFIPGAAAGPGGVVARGVQAVVPAVASEAAGQLVKGSSIEQPVRIASALLAGGGTGAAQHLLGGGGKATKAIGTAPTVEELQKTSSAAYKAVDDSGLTLSQPAYDKLLTNIVNVAKKESSIGGPLKSVTEKLYINSKALVDDLETTRGATPKLGDIDQARRVAKEIAKLPGSDGHVGRAIVGQIDDYLDDLRPTDVIAGNVDEAMGALRTGRASYRQMRQGEVIEDLIEKAEVKSNRFSGSGKENAIRREFTNLAANPKKMRLLTPELQAMVKKVAEGGRVDNALRAIGRFAPTGVVSSAIGNMLGYAIGGPAGMVAVPAVGAAARMGATRATERNAEMASEVARGGSGVIPEGLTIEQMQRALALTLQANAAANANTED